MRKYLDTTPLQMLKKIERSLKPGGHLIISTPSRYRLPNLIRVLVGKPIVLGSRQHVTEYSVGQVMEQLKYLGYEVEYNRKTSVVRRSSDIQKDCLAIDWLSA